jgi:hypothetical protein
LAASRAATAAASFVCAVVTLPARAVTAAEVVPIAVLFKDHGSFLD